MDYKIDRDQEEKDIGNLAAMPGHKSFYRPQNFSDFSGIVEVIITGRETYPPFYQLLDDSRRMLYDPILNAWDKLINPRMKGGKGNVQDS